MSADIFSKLNSFRNTIRVVRLFHLLKKGNQVLFIRLFHLLKKGNQILFISYRINKLFKPHKRACIS